MFIRKLCPNCQRGIDTLKTGGTSMCPYLNCHTKGQCTQFLPINRYSKMSFFGEMIKKFKWW